jgi:NADH-quinone oxidoreductase subunit G
MSLVTITINGENYKVEFGELLIDTLINNNIDIPYFCYHESLGADGNCRMCMVEIEGQKRPQIACDTFVKDGMVINTHNEKINGVRKDILELELINHPIDCPICDQAGECKLQDFYMDYGLYDSNIEVKDKVNHKKHIDLGSQVMLDQERCVLCARCVRFTTNVTKTGELGIINRGDHACISTMPGNKLDNDYAMNVVDLCPVGALTSKDFRFAQRVWFLTSTESICHGCERGCNIYIDHNKEKYKEDKIYRFRPRINKTINGHFICDEGRLSYKEMQNNRQEVCLLDKNEISNEDAVYYLNTKIKESRNIVILVDPNLYSEDMGSIFGFAKDIGARVISPLKSYYDESFGDDWLKTSYRCANKRTLKEYGIEECLNDTSYIDLLINFNHKDIDDFRAKEKISFQSHKNYEADLILPIPVYSEYSGTVMNIDGVKQYCNQAIYNSNKVEQIAIWVERLKKLKEGKS